MTEPLPTDEPGLPATATEPTSSVEDRGGPDLLWLALYGPLGSACLALALRSTLGKTATFVLLGVLITTCITVWAVQFIRRTDG